MTLLLPCSFRQNACFMKPKIFLVDDDTLFQTTLAHHLAIKKGYEVTSFSTGEECLKNLDQEPEVIILDYNLDATQEGIINGLTVLRITKRRKPNVHVIVLSGVEDASIVAKLLYNGAFNYVMKGEDAFNRTDHAIEAALRETQLSSLWD